MTGKVNPFINSTGTIQPEKLKGNEDGKKSGKDYKIEESGKIR